MLLLIFLLLFFIVLIGYSIKSESRFTCEKCAMKEQCIKSKDPICKI